MQTVKTQKSCIFKSGIVFSHKCSQTSPLVEITQLKISTNDEIQLHLLHCLHAETYIT